MTFGEKRRALRRFRVLAARLRAQVNARGRAALDGFSFTLPEEEFDALEFGLAHLKVRVPDVDDEGELIPGSGRLMRQNFVFQMPKIAREHLIFKAVPVFRQEGWR